MYDFSAVSKISNVLSTISSIVGTIFFFINIKVTIICAILAIIDSFIQVIFGDQNNLVTEILTVIVAVIVALIRDANIFHYAAFALCVVSAVFTVIGWIFMLFAYKSRF